MSLSSPTYTDLDFSFVPGSPAFAAALFSEESSWPVDSSLSLLDDCDSVSLSHSSSDESSTVSGFTQPIDTSMTFAEELNLTSPLAFHLKQSPTFANTSPVQFASSGFKFDTFQFEVPALQNLVYDAEPGAPVDSGFPRVQSEPAFVPVTVPPPVLVQSQSEPVKKQSRKRGSSSSNSSIASAESNDSIKTKEAKRVKVSGEQKIEISSPARSTSSSVDSSVARIDANLVSSLLAENQLKKHRLARKAELARLGRKAKNDQIESLQQKVKELSTKLQDAKDRNAELMVSAGAPLVKVEPGLPTAVSLRGFLTALDASYSSDETLVMRFMAWLAHQNDRFYCESNTRGLLASLCDKQLQLTEQQKSSFVHLLKMLASKHHHGSPVDLFDSADRVIKQLKTTSK